MTSKQEKQTTRQARAGVREAKQHRALRLDNKKRPAAKEREEGGGMSDGQSIAALTLMGLLLTAGVAWGLKRIGYW